MGYLHDPQSVLDGEFDWRPWLHDTEMIISQTVVADGDLEVTDVSESGGVVTYWLTGGTASTTPQRVTCHITTNMGRQDDRSDTVRVVDR